MYVFVSLYLSLSHTTVFATVQGMKRLAGQESTNMCSVLGMQYNAICSELETELEHDEQQRQQDEQTCASWRGGGR